MENLTAEMTMIRGEVTHVKTRIDDVHEMLIIALSSGGFLGERRKLKEMRENNEEV